MALSTLESDLLTRLQRHLDANRASDATLLGYYDTEVAFRHIGLAMPPQYRREYDVITSGAAVVVDSVVERQQVRSLILPGEEDADPQLLAIWDGSNMDAQAGMFNRDRRIYGRGFFSVATNDTSPELPLIRAESPTEMVGEIDPRREVVKHAARFYGVNQHGSGPTHATLYLPEKTVWLERADSGPKWSVVDVDEHKMGRVPIFMHLNRAVTGSWRGRSALTRGVRSIIDGACRNLTNMQFAIESHGIPRIYMTGVARGDFIDPKTGEPLPAWAAYYNAIHTLTNSDAKVGQLSASDLANFREAQKIYATEMMAATGLPASYFGITTANPAAEGAIVGEEKRLVRTVERENVEVGTTIGWVAALAYELATGREVVGNRVRVDWHNPATPTIAQRMDAIVKAKAAGILSREGAWDELGWSEARKAKERTRFTEESANDPELALAGEMLRGASRQLP